MPNDDPVENDQWEACNNLVISWIMNSVSELISRFMLFIQSDVKFEINLRSDLVCVMALENTD